MTLLEFQKMVNDYVEKYPEHGKLDMIVDVGEGPEIIDHLYKSKAYYRKANHLAMREVMKIG